MARFIAWMMRLGAYCIMSGVFTLAKYMLPGASWPAICMVLFVEWLCISFAFMLVGMSFKIARRPKLNSEEVQQMMRAVREAESRASRGGEHGGG